MGSRQVPDNVWGFPTAFATQSSDRKNRLGLRRFLTTDFPVLKNPLMFLMILKRQKTTKRAIHRLAGESLIVMRAGAVTVLDA